MSEPLAEEFGPEDELTEEAAEPAKLTGLAFLQMAIQSPNLAEKLDESTLAQIGAKVWEEYGIDVASLEENNWRKRCDDAMKMALLVEEAKSYPWENASNVKYPLVIEAAVKFNARAYPAVIDGPDIVKGAVKGRNTPEKTERAERIGKHMSWQLLEEMDGWEEDTDRLLMQIPIVGCAFRKTWFDPLKGYNCSQLVPAKNFVVNYWTRDLETCPRATHELTFYPHEVTEKMRGGVWLDVDLGRPISAANDDQAPFTFLEQHRLWDLDGDDYPEPYIVTVEKESQRVVRIVARFDERGVKLDGETVVRIEPNRCFTKYGFIPAPDGSFYDIGYGTLLGPLGNTINSTINQLMDAGHLANVQGGFIGEGVSIKSGNLRFRPGEWKKVAVAGPSLRDGIVPLPTKEPSAVLYNLMVFLIEAGKDLTATQDILGGDAGKGTMPVGTISALIEQGLKTFTAIVKRIHRALKQELAVLYKLNGRFLEPEVYFTFQDVEGVIAQQDYAAEDMDVVPVSDPNMATDMQRMAQAQFVMQFAAIPGANQRAMALRSLEAARVPDPEELFPEQQGPPPPDPKAIEAEAKAKAKDRELDIDEATAAADIAHKNAETERFVLETMMAGPQFAQMMDQMVQARVQQALAMVNNAGAPQVRPEDVRGMEGPPADGGVPPIPQGPEVGPDGAMGGGFDPGQPPPDQGPPMGGAGGPQLG